MEQPRIINYTTKPFVFRNRKQRALFKIRWKNAMRKNKTSFCIFANDEDVKWINCRIEDLYEETCKTCGRPIRDLGFCPKCDTQAESR